MLGVYKCRIYEPQREVTYLWFISRIQSHIPTLLLFDDGMRVCVTKPFTPRGGVIVLMQPISNLLEVPTLFTEVGNRLK